MTGGRRKGRVGWTATVAAVAAAYLVASTVASLHLALESHAICAEHGELVHRGHEDGPGEAARPSTDPGTIALRGAGGPASEPLHEHCSLASHRPGIAVEAGRSPGLCTDVPPGFASPLTSCDVIPRDRDITDLAPKHSPPVS